LSLPSHRPYHTISPLVEHPVSSPGSAYTTAPPYLPPIASQIRSSPVQVPPPLRFNYSATPPDALQNYHDYRPSSAQSYTTSHSQTRAQNFPEFLIPAMPPRRKPAADNVTMSGTPATISSTTSSSRPRKGVKGNGWTMEHTYDSIGQKKEVIVIDDSQTPEHPPRKRTRAQVAAENAAANGSGPDQRNYPSTTTLSQRYGNGHLTNGSTAHSVASTSSAGKKRKVDEGSDSASKKKGKATVSLVSIQLVLS
jgi:dual-specificity kinase